LAIELIINRLFWSNNHKHHSDSSWTYRFGIVRT
jgi:hypothetical protein